MTDDKIKHMVNRFLGWFLPENFSPDGGISFEPYGNKGTPHQYKRVPSGTNLLDAIQATAMVHHMVAEMPASKEETGWLIERNDTRVPTWWGPQCSRWEWQQALVSPDLWTTDASNAVRFARKEDAEKQIHFEGLQRVAIAIDHLWC